MNQVLTQFGDIEPFLKENQDIAPRLADHLRVPLDDQERRKLLIMELAAVIDAGEAFVKARPDPADGGTCHLCLPPGSTYVMSGRPSKCLCD